MNTDDYINEICPDNMKLIVDENGNITTKIVDMELDILDCSFNNDDCVEINTKNYSYIVLSKEHLYQLIQLIEDSEAMYESQEDE